MHWRQTSGHHNVEKYLPRVDIVVGEGQNGAILVITELAGFHSLREAARDAAQYTILYENVVSRGKVPTLRLIMVSGRRLLDHVSEMA